MGSGAFPLCATRVPLGGMCVLVYTTRFLLNSPMTRLAWSDCAGKSKSLCRRQGVVGMPQAIIDALTGLQPESRVCQGAI